MECRVLKCKNCKITQHYGVNGHSGVDIVALINGKCTTDYVTAHTGGTVIAVVKNYNRTDKTGTSYGNYVQIQHYDGYTTLYAHLKYGSVTVSKGQKVTKGQILGYMGNTGRSAGAHLHFEVRKKVTYESHINPEPYLNADLPNMYSVEYRVHCNGRWFNTTSNGSPAGNLRNEVDGYQVKTFNGAGKLYYRCHIKNQGWLDSVAKWDDTPDGYSGIIGYPIDAITMWSEHGDLTYRVHYNGQWSSWIKGKYGTNKGEYAGIIGKTIDGMEIKFS